MVPHSLPHNTFLRASSISCTKCVKIIRYMIYTLIAKNLSVSPKYRDAINNDRTQLLSSR